MHLLARAEDNAVLKASALSARLTTSIQNSKIAFAKALFGMSITEKAKTTLKFMVFNLANKTKGTYRDAIIITRGLAHRRTTHPGKTIPSLTTGVIDNVLQFAGISPGNIDLCHIVPTKSEVMEETQQSSVISRVAQTSNLLSPGCSIS